MPDLTHIFRSTVQDLNQSSGSSRPSPAPQRPRSTQDPWLKEAHQISRTMADLRAFILTTRPAYLNLSRGGGASSHGGMRIPRRADSMPKNGTASSSSPSTQNGSASSKALHDLLETVSSLTSLSDKDRDSIDTQAKVMMRQIKGAIEELESLEQDRRKKLQRNSRVAVAGLNQLLGGFGGGPVDDLAQHRQGVTLYLNERLASVATLHKDQYEARIAREMEKRESSLFKALPKPKAGGVNGFGMNRFDPEGSGLSRRNNTQGAGNGIASGPPSRTGSPAPSASTTSSPSFSSPAHSSGPSSRHAAGTIGSNRADASGISSSQYYHQSATSASGGYQDGFVQEEGEADFEQSLTAQERQMLELENENIVQKLETELNQVRQLESSMLELSSLHNTIQEHLEIQTLQTNRLHEDALTAIDFIASGNDQLLKAGKRNNSTRKWILFFLILASFVLLFLDWYD